MNYNWNWFIFLEPSPYGSLYITTLLNGLLWTVFTAVLAWTIALSVGVLVGVARTTNHNLLRFLGSAYVEVFRNIPLLVQIFLWYFVIPELVPVSLGAWMKQIPPPWGSFVPAVLCLGFYTASRVAEQVRASIESIPKGQRMAGSAIGLSPSQVYRYVLLPNAFRITFPPLTSELLNLIKNTSVAFTIGLMELVGATRSMQEFSFQVFETFAAATVLYLFLNLLVVWAASYIEKRLQIPKNNGVVLAESTMERI